MKSSPLGIALAVGLLTLGTCTTAGPEAETAALSFPSKTFSGTWDAAAPSTLQFLSASRLRYCFRNECTTRPYSGSAVSKVEFNWGRNQFTFAKAGAGYRGTFLGSDGTRSTVRMK